MRSEHVLKIYNQKITDLKKPDFIMNLNWEEWYIPSEFYTIGVIFKTIREEPKGFASRSTRKSPMKKLKISRTLIRTINVEVP